MSNDLSGLSYGGWVLQHKDDPFMFVGKRGRRRVALAHAHIHAHHRTAEGKSLRPEYHGTQLRHVTVTLT